MDVGDEREWVKSLYDLKKFLFTYNGIADSNPNPNHDIKEFW